ncbi:MAG: kelch repeat-containing protein [Chloroflexota bacterium]
MKARAALSLFLLLLLTAVSLFHIAPVDAQINPQTGLPGDVSCDGPVTTSDSLLIIQFVVGQRTAESSCPLTNPATSLNVVACDVDGDAICNNTDALYLLQCNTGIGNSFCSLPVWNQISTVNAPPVLSGVEMAHDSNRNVTVLYGGSDTFPFNGATWEYDGSDWDLKDSAGAPNARFGAPLLHLPGSSQILYFGGSDDAAQIYDESWIYLPTGWQQNTFTTGAPDPRTGHAVVFDPSLNLNFGVYLFGGNNGSTYYNDIWTYDVLTWSELTPSIGSAGPPTARSRHGMAASSDQLLLFGGEASDGSVLGDTWVFDSSNDNWVEVTGVLQPPARRGHELVYDAIKNRYLLLGGVDGNGSRLTDAWQFTTARGWEEVILPTGPDLSKPFAITYDSTRGVIILFSDGETWELS